MTIRSMILVATILMATILGAGFASAQQTSAGQTWLCSVGSAVAVDEDGTVGPPDTGERERPTFFRLDAEKQELTLLAPPSRRGEVTKLRHVHEAEGHTVFSGVESGRGLNVVITEEGRMTLSVVGDGVVWSVFGHALRESDAK